jgi:lipoate-protein ligase A
MILWHDGAHDAPFNMARDEALLERAVADPAAPPVLRLFAFDPPGITLGRAQDAERELDLDGLDRAGVRWASRPTGGRAIWHEEEWTFSLVTRLGPSGWAASPAAAYVRTAALLARALQRLGVPAVLSPGSARGVGAPRAPAGAAPPCFASTARHELSLEGRKLAGIAQRAVRGALLQQGSILLGDTHASLARWVRAADPEREALARAWRAGAAPAGRWLEADRSLARLEEALAGLLAAEGDVRRLRAEEGAHTLGVGALPRRSGRDCLGASPDYTARRL